MATDKPRKQYKRRTPAIEREDQRVLAFREYYTNPKSKTFNNILQSGIKAGYSEEYSQNISHLKPSWWVELQEELGSFKKKMLIKAEKNIDEFLEEKDKQLKAKASFFVSERIGKEDWSTRQELTDKGGRRLFSDKSKDVASIALSDLFKGVQQP